MTHISEQPGYLKNIWDFVRPRHAGQTRDGGEPYENHLWRVERRVFEWGVKDPIKRAACYGHDLFEDTETSFEEFVEVAGIEAANYVLEVTNKLPYGTRFPEKHAALLAKAKSFSDGAKIIKLADRMDNITDCLVSWPRHRVLRYCKSTFELLDVMSPMPEGFEKYAQDLLAISEKGLSKAQDPNSHFPN